MNEEILNGGVINSVTRRGDLVFRTGGPWVPAIHAVLSHLTCVGFPYAPKPLGVDDAGREMLSFLPGETMMRPWRPVMFTNDALVQAATMLRQLHDATRDLAFPPQTEWRPGRAEKQPGQVIRHGDLGPWNTLWEGDRLTGLIDWDFAEPGSALTDLAQMALYFVPLRGDAHWRTRGFPEKPDFGHRVMVLCEAYGEFTMRDVLLEIAQLQRSAMTEIIERADAGRYPWTMFRDKGEVERTQGEIDWLCSILPDLFEESGP